MGISKGSHVSQRKFPEFVERDGKKYQIFSKFCRESGKSIGYMKFLAASWEGIDSILVDYGTCKRRYVYVDEVGKINGIKRYSFYKAEEFIEEEGRVYQIITEYCKRNNVNLNTARLRIKHRTKNPKYRLDGKKIKTPHGNLWYVFVGFKKSGARREYLEMRKKNLELGKKTGKRLRDLTERVEDCEDEE